jgi:hypothetical protein
MEVFMKTHFWLSMLFVAGLFFTVGHSMAGKGPTLSEAALLCRPGTIVKFCSPAEKIVQASAESNADLIVLGVWAVKAHLGPANAFSMGEGAQSDYKGELSGTYPREVNRPECREHSAGCIDHAKRRPPCDRGSEDLFMQSCCSS